MNNAPQSSQIHSLIQSHLAIIFLSMLLLISCKTDVVTPPQVETLPTTPAIRLLNPIGDLTVNRTQVVLWELESGSTSNAGKPDNVFWDSTGKKLSYTVASSDLSAVSARLNTSEPRYQGRPALLLLVNPSAPVGKRVLITLTANNGSTTATTEFSVTITAGGQTAIPDTVGSLRIYNPVAPLELKRTEDGLVELEPFGLRDDDYSQYIFRESLGKKLTYTAQSGDPTIYAVSLTNRFNGRPTLHVSNSPNAPIGSRTKIAVTATNGVSTVTMFIDAIIFGNGYSGASPTLFLINPLQNRTMASGSSETIELEAPGKRSDGTPNSIFREVSGNALSYSVRSSNSSIVEATIYQTNTSSTYRSKMELKVGQGAQRGSWSVFNLRATNGAMAVENVFIVTVQ